VGTVPADVRRVEITTSEGPGAVQDSCQREATPGFERVCFVVAVIPPANDLSTYRLTVRFMDADRNELYPALKDF
jgi:hypothetical protein